MSDVGNRTAQSTDLVSTLTEKALYWWRRRVRLTFRVRDELGKSWRHAWSDAGLIQAVTIEQLLILTAERVQRDAPTRLYSSSGDTYVEYAERG